MNGEAWIRRYVGSIFNYANNFLTLLGIVLATFSGVTIVVFMLGELAGGLRNPYIGIFAYMVLPGVLAVALVIIPLGMWLRRRRLVASGVPAAERARFPRLDFNDRRLRRVASVVLALTVVNAVIFGISSYLAVEELESTQFCGTSCHLMTPEYTAYQGSPHSRVACTECHIGPGASWFVRSKIDGVRQVWKTALDSYPRPIPTPIEDLRPARETCEQCHWPAKHYGDSLKIIARFASDEANTASYSALVVNTGGGSVELGDYGGIHWRHIASDNRIRYYAKDEERQEIAWVELTNRDGEVRVYRREGEELPPAEEIEANARVMDCIDCHSRPTHLFPVPSDALDETLASHPSLTALPYFKRQAVAAIESDGSPTRDAGMERVRQALVDFYRSGYPALWGSHRELVEEGAAVAARVYGASVFPEMKVDWRTHPNNIGHESFPGCWRCHDEELATADGEHVISVDCEQCHVFLVEGSPKPPDLSAL